MALESPFDLKGRGSSKYTQFHQLPICSILVSINGKPVNSLEDVTSGTANDEDFNCRFHLPKAPPALPDFIVLRCDAYKERGGPNILKFSGTENLIPIPCTNVSRKLPPDTN